MLAPHVNKGGGPGWVIRSLVADPDVPKADLRRQRLLVRLRRPRTGARPPYRWRQPVSALGQGRLWPAGEWHSRSTPSSGNTRAFGHLRFVPKTERSYCSFTRPVNQRRARGEPGILFHPGGSEPPGLVVAAAGSGARIKPSWSIAVSASSCPNSSAIRPCSTRRTEVPANFIFRPEAAGIEPMRKSQKAGPV
jgi:hypothetical protein